MRSDTPCQTKIVVPLLLLMEVVFWPDGLEQWTEWGEMVYKIKDIRKQGPTYGSSNRDRVKANEKLFDRRSELS